MKGIVRPDRKTILGLYKQLLRYSETFKYTNRDYYYHRIRGQFEKNKELSDPTEIAFQFQKGRVFLYNKRMI